MGEGNKNFQGTPARCLLEKNDVCTIVYRLFMNPFHPWMELSKEECDD